MKKFAILILCGLIALTGCYQTTDVGETYAVESEVSEIVSIENDEAYVLENEMSDAISTEIDETSYSYTDIIAIADEAIECLDDLCGIQVEEAMSESEEVHVEELQALGLIRKPTEEEWNQYNIYLKTVKDFVNSSSSYEKIRSEYDSLFDMVINNNKELETQAVVDFSQGDRVFVMGFPEISAVPELREILENPISEDYEKRYAEYENQQTTCLILQYAYADALGQGEYYLAVKLLNDYNNEVARFFDMETNLK